MFQDDLFAIGHDFGQVDTAQGGFSHCDVVQRLLIGSVLIRKDHNESKM